MIIKNWVREYFNREKVFNNISILFDWWRKRIKGLLIDYELKFIEYLCKCKYILYYKLINYYLNLLLGNLLF